MSDVLRGCYEETASEEFRFYYRRINVLLLNAACTATERRKYACKKKYRRITEHASIVKIVRRQKCL